ncbi:MFS transporter [Salinifilum ghardaiensis]
MVGGLTLFVPQYLQATQGLDALQAGALVAPAALGLIVGALLAPMAAHRWAVGTVIAAGLLAACAGLLVVAYGVTVGPTWVIAGLVMLYLGSGPFDALGTDLVVGSAPPDKAGSAGAATETASELGTGLGIAVLGTIGTVVYQNRIAAELPADLPDSTAAAARESLSGAAASAANLDNLHGDAVAEAANTAFTSGIQAVSLVAAILAAILALATLLLFRRTM